MSILLDFSTLADGVSILLDFSTLATQPVNLDAWPAGTKVVVQGLVKAAELNGRTGTIVQWMVGKGRCHVDLGGGSNSIKPANLKLG